MASVKAWKVGHPDSPPFPEEFEIVKKAVLQVTDIKTNHNKYYAIELHKATHKGKTVFRVYTHYGRTDDLETNPDAGQKECRFFDTVIEADANYQSIFREKTGTKKGYREVSLASSKIGSQKARGTSTGEVDAKTLERLAPKTADGTPAPAPVAKQSTLHQGVQRLVRYIYDEATSALTTTVSAKITAQGIETPLGILTVGQIEKGEKILTTMYELYEKKAKNLKSELERLSGDFYSAIPHRIGRTKAAVASAIIDNLTAFEQKQSTLQLMKDMLQINGEGGSVLFDAKIDTEYEALKCEVGILDPDGSQFKELAEYVVKSQIKSKTIKVKHIYTLKRPGEWGEFTEKMDNKRLLFHGSRIQNWVGILSRGILLPKIVVSMGVNRTDAGWLGNGIYFGDAACTSVFYTTPGRHKTRLIAIANVALGKMKDYTKITYGLNKPPEGFDSCHGVRNQKGVASEFADDEYVIYTGHQQRLEFLAEVTA